MTHKRILVIILVQLVFYKHSKLAVTFSDLIHRPDEGSF